MIEGVGIHQLIFDENNTPIDYIILKVNKGFEEILGYKKEDVEGKLASISHTGIIFNNEKAILEIFQDITDRKMSENRLERAEIIAKTGNWELHINDQIIIISEGLKRIYGTSNLNYQNMKNFILPEYKLILDDALKNLIENNESYDIEYKIKTFNDEIKFIHSIANYDRKNKIVFGVIQDITEIKKNEIALEKSNAVKSTFLSNISHELRTPLNAIVGFSDIIYSDLNTGFKDKKFDRFIKSINTNAKHLEELLNNILDYSKMESDVVDLMYEDFSINDMFEELLDVFVDINYKKNLDFVKLEVILVDNDQKITSDYLRLKQILYNLISNSIKFTESGHIKLSVNVYNNVATFKVEDTGIGIPEDKIPFVFDRFWQCDSSSRKKYKGTGLGLSICKGLTELLNGKIWVESILNKGTSVSVRVPTKRERLIEDEITDFSGKTILLIDDVPAIFSLLGIYLSSLHINVISITDENDAMEIYKKQKDKIDLIIIDLNLFNINEIDLIKKMKKICENCLIISKSGKENKQDVADYHLVNPINKDKLISLLNNIWQK